MGLAQGKLKTKFDDRSPEEPIIKKKSRIFSFKGESPNDKSRPFWELIANWKEEDIEALNQEFEALQLLRELRIDVDNARAPVRSIGEQLFHERHRSKCTFKMANNKLHISPTLLRHRCDHIPWQDCEKTSVGMPLFIQKQDIEKFILYLYTDKWNGDPLTLETLRGFYSCKRPLKEDLELMEHSSDSDGDFTISFVSIVAGEEQQIVENYSIQVHSDILMARSSYFCQLLKKSEKSKISINEELFPREFANLIRYFIYTDVLDFSKIPDGVVPQSSLSEARAIVAGRNLNTRLAQAIRLVNVARFFNLWKLVQLCEDVIVGALSMDSCVMITNWSIANQSTYVCKKAQRYLEENFSRIALSRHFINLDSTSLLDLVRSPFVQATELEILEATIRWITKEGAEGTLDSFPCYAEFYFEASNQEDRQEIASELMEHIRPDFVLPAFNERLNEAFKKGYLTRPPLKIRTSTAEIDENPDIHWVKPDEPLMGTRLYFPYYKVLKDKLSTIKRASIVENPSSPKLVARVKLTEERADGMGYLEMASKKMNSIVQWAKTKYDFNHLIRDYHKKMAVQLIACLALHAAPLRPIEVEIVYGQTETSSVDTNTLISHCTRNLPDLTLLPYEFSRVSTLRSDIRPADDEIEPVEASSSNV